MNVFSFMNVFVGHMVTKNQPTSDVVPVEFYAVAPDLSTALKIIHTQEPNFQVMCIDRFDYIPIVSPTISLQGLSKPVITAGFVIRVRVELFAEIQEHSEQVDHIYRAFFVVAEGDQEALFELTRFLTERYQVRDVTVIGLDRVGPEFKIFIHA